MDKKNKEVKVINNTSIPLKFVSISSEIESKLEMVKDAGPEIINPNEEGIVVLGDYPVIIEYFIALAYRDLKLNIHVPESVCDYEANLAADHLIQSELETISGTKITLESNHDSEQNIISIILSESK